MEDFPDSFPRIEYEFTLDPNERADLLELENEFRRTPERIAAATAIPEGETHQPLTLPPAPAKQVTSTPEAASPESDEDEEEEANDDEEEEEGEDNELDEEEDADDEVEGTNPTEAANEDDQALVVTLPPLKEVGPEILMVRMGLNGDLRFRVPSNIHAEFFRAFLRDKLPRIELFESQRHLRDSVSYDELDDEEFEFMRGIFHYAELDPDDCERLFTQTDATEMQLQLATNRLAATLQASWAQGQNLDFVLRHRQGRIELMIHDPSVKSRYVRASRRHSGFTHFFTLQTILHSRRRENPAESYIYLFDEPGVYLHPSGQHDLLKVLERIGVSYQIAYSTHSIFMLNRTFPSRHRLVYKDEAGTKLNTKPYAGRWAPALDALGVSMASTALFADYFLLCEGDSDAILIPALLQALSRFRPTKDPIDLNSVAFLSTGDAKDTHALIRILNEAVVKPSLAVLVDGDDGGKKRLAYLKPLLDKMQVPAKPLESGKSTEDLLPRPRELYVRAIATYARRLAQDFSKTIASEQQVLDDALASYDEEFSKPSGKSSSRRGKSSATSKPVLVGMAAWGQETCMRLSGLDEPPSKVGIAREYVALLEQLPDGSLSEGDLAGPIYLAGLIDQVLKLPRLSEVATTVLVTS